ncbi:MAG TPA: hypothetical protein PLP42_21490 [Acidobacteriota bacterium]|jgi:hypothetical protein|nr:hypothetical protein [Acidobacteriota bacterium]
MRILRAAVLLLFLVQGHAANLPTVLSLEKRLENEIDKMVEAGLLRPAYHNSHEKLWHHQGHDIPNAWDDYFSNPALTIYALIEALPYLSPAKQQSARAYIQAEWTERPPYLYTHGGWQGARREIVDIPEESFLYYSSGIIKNASGQRLKPGVHDRWAGFSFNPFNFYACYLYAREFGGAASILSQVSRKVAEYPKSVVNGGTPLTRRPHLLNMYLAGYEGFLRLQALAGVPLSDSVKGWRENAYAELIKILTTTKPEELRQTEAGGFLYLVPEVAEELRSRLTPAQLSQIRDLAEQYGSYAVPYWFVAGMDEVDRLGPREASQLEEGSTSLYYDYWSLFNAKALLFQESRNELERYLDVPSVWRGDLFYILNVVNTLKAGSSTPTLTAPTGLRVTGVN